MKMPNFDWKALWEAVKEPLREIAIAIIPFVLERLSVLNEVWAVALYLVLRGIDKWLHEHAPSGESGGLTRF